MSNFALRTATVEELIDAHHLDLVELKKQITSIKADISAIAFSVHCLNAGSPESATKTREQLVRENKALNDKVRDLTTTQGRNHYEV